MVSNSRLKSWACYWTLKCHAPDSNTPHPFFSQNRHSQAIFRQRVGGTRSASLTSGQADRLPISPTTSGTVRHILTENPGLINSDPSFLTAKWVSSRAVTGVTFLTEVSCEVSQGRAPRRHGGQERSLWSLQDGFAASNDTGTLALLRLQTLGGRQGIKSHHYAARGESAASAWWDSETDRVIAEAHFFSGGKKLNHGGDLAAAQIRIEDDQESQSRSGSKPDPVVDCPIVTFSVEFIGEPLVLVQLFDQICVEVSPCDCVYR